MPIKRFHRKSRKGCLQCRRRRIKCDEAHPVCFNCVRAQFSCDYALILSPVEQQEQAYAQAPVPVPRTITNPGPHQPPLSPSSTEDASPLPQQDAGMPLFDSLDLILMNHFTAITSLSLFDSPRNTHVWQRHIPFEARSNAMLMHGLLAVAALHLTITTKTALHSNSSDNTYHARALHHYSLGLQLFNTQIKQLSPENSHALFTFSMLLVVWVFAAPILSNDTLTLDEILNSLRLIRGCKTLFILHHETILNRPVGRIVEILQRPPSPAYCSLLVPQIPTILHDLFNNLHNKALDDPVYIEAISELRTIVSKALDPITGAQNTRLIAAWPANVSEEYWSRLLHHEPMAVLVFAHYIVLLQQYEDEYWWLKGWSRSILKAGEGELSSAQRERLDWEGCFLKIMSLTNSRARAHGEADTGPQGNRIPMSFQVL